MQVKSSAECSKLPIVIKFFVLSILSGRFTQVLLYKVLIRTTNLAIYFSETSQDKLSKAKNRQSIIVIKVHEKLHENLFYMLISLFNFESLIFEMALMKTLVKSA